MKGSKARNRKDLPIETQEENVESGIGDEDFNAYATVPLLFVAANFFRNYLRMSADE